MGNCSSIKCICLCFLLIQVAVYAGFWYVASRAWKSTEGGEEGRNGTNFENVKRSSAVVLDHFIRKLAPFRVSTLRWERQVTKTTFLSIGSCPIDFCHGNARINPELQLIKFLPVSGVLGPKSGNTDEHLNLPLAAETGLQPQQNRNRKPPCDNNPSSSSAMPTAAVAMSVTPTPSLTSEDQVLPILFYWEHVMTHVFRSGTLAIYIVSVCHWP